METHFDGNSNMRVNEHGLTYKIGYSEDDFIRSLITIVEYREDGSVLGVWKRKIDPATGEMSGPLIPALKSIEYNRGFNHGEGEE